VTTGSIVIESYLADDLLCITPDIIEYDATSVVVAAPFVKVGDS